MTTQASILIADAQAARAEAIAQAFAAAGQRVRVAAHGAAALEIALSDPPRIAVVHAELPLVDAAKLAEILRANPRTRDIHLVVFGREARRQALGAIADAWLDESAPADEVVALSAQLLERQARLDRLDLGAYEASVLDGSLLDLRPVELLRMLHVRRASGELVVAPPKEQAERPNARIRFAGGEVCAVELGPLSGEKALFRLLVWADGSFRFTPGAVDGPTRMASPTRTLLAEGARQFEEWTRMAPRLPAADTPVRLAVARGALPPVLHPVTQEVLAAIERSTTVADVVDQCSPSDYQVLRTLQTLADRGIVQLGRARAAMPDPIAHALFSDAQARRLRGFASSGRGSESHAPVLKLMVVAPDASAVRRFAALLEKVPGAELAPAVHRERKGGERAGEIALATFARIAVDGELSLELIHLPVGGAFAPLWRFAAHRALGTIFLLDPRMGESAQALADVTAALADDPTARSFHVVLLPPGERVSPDDLRRNLALLDSASLFLLPIDPNKDAGSLLRSLFARIVP